MTHDTPNFEQNHKITWMQNIAINIINIWPVTHRIFMISLGAYIFWHQSRSMIQRQGNAQAWHAKGIGRKTAFTSDGSRLCWNTKLMDTIGPNTHVCHSPLQTQGWQMANCTHLCHKLQKPTKLSSVQRMMHFRFQSHFSATVRASDFHTFWSFRCLCIILEPFKWKSSTQQFLTLPSSSSPSLHSLPHPGPGASLGSPKSSKLFVKKKHMIKHPILIGEPPFFWNTPLQKEAEISLVMDSGLIGQTAENSTTCEDAGKGINMYTLYAPFIWHIEHVAYLCMYIYIYIYTHAIMCVCACNQEANTTAALRASGVTCTRKTWKTQGHRSIFNSKLPST